jgi:hypothetical protein
MNHPSREEWMSYIYHESEGAERAGLDAHLRECERCTSQLREWRVAQKRLDDWRLAPAPPAQIANPARALWSAATLRWSAAAVLTLMMGFAAGRAGSAMDARKLRAAIEPEIRQQLSQEFAQMLKAEIGRASADTLAAAGSQSRDLLAVYASAAEDRDTAVHSDIYDQLDRLESQHLADYLSLKKDLDTVAINTDTDLRNQQQELAFVARAEHPASVTNTIDQ